MALGLHVELLSGDTPLAVAAAADGAGVGHWTAAANPAAAKAARISDLLRQGRRPLMVGDGLNDAGALAHASSTLADSTGLVQSVSNIVLRGPDLSALPAAIVAAQRAMRLSRQNIALSVAYNAVAVPAAMLGLMTPLLAALVMARSSLAVILNALRAARYKDAPSKSNPRRPGLRQPWTLLGSQVVREALPHLVRHGPAQRATEFAHAAAQVIQLVQQRQHDRQRLLVDLHGVAQLTD